MELSDLKTYVKQRLEDLSNINVYDTKAPDNATFPYLVYKFSACNYLVRERKDWILELDFWNDSNNDSEILQAAEYVKNGRESYSGMNISTQNESEGFYYCHIDFEGEIEDPEHDITRYNQIYILKVD
jgi:predicted metal-binding protein